MPKRFIPARIAEEKGGEGKRGYTIAGAETAGSGAGAPAADEKPVVSRNLWPRPMSKAGQVQSKKCASCHTFDKGGKNGVGPNQWGLVGSSWAHKDDYHALPQALGLRKKGKKNLGRRRTLSDFLTNPMKDIPGTKMSFAGIKNPQDRANLIAWLGTLK